MKFDESIASGDCAFYLYISSLQISDLAALLFDPAIVVRIHSVRMNLAVGGRWNLDREVASQPKAQEVYQAIL
jgi:hypothetical protein